MDNFNDSSGHFYLQDEIILRVLEALLNGSVITNLINGDDHQKCFFTGELRNVWAHREISRVVLLFTVLYWAESWTFSGKDYIRLNVFHIKRLKAIIYKRRDEKITKELKV